MADRLDQGLNDSQHASLLNRAITFDFMLNQPGGSVTLDEMSAEEYGVIQLIKSERDRYTEERHKEMERQAASNRKR